MYEIYVSTNYGPYEPYECPLLTYERAKLLIKRLEYIAGCFHRYEIRKVA